MNRLHKREPGRARDPNAVAEDDALALDCKLGLKITDKVLLRQLEGGFQTELDISSALE